MKSIYAFIDSQNLNLGIIDQGWKLDFKKFYIYLRDKYNVDKAFIFIGFMKENLDLYRFLQSMGYILIFKPVVKYDSTNKFRFIKGNVDAELVLQSMIEYNNYYQAIIISGDGDFYCLIKYLLKQHKLFKIIAPDWNNYSSLLKKFMPRLIFMNMLKAKLEYKKSH
jgi:uncharacterized LabA/DUF88 family protein